MMGSDNRAKNGALSHAWNFTSCASFKCHPHEMFSSKIFMELSFGLLNYLKFRSSQFWRLVDRKYPVLSPFSFVSYDTQAARAWDRSLVIARELSFIISRERALPHRIVQYRTCWDLLLAPKSALNPINYSLGWRWREYTISRRRKKESKFPFWNYLISHVKFSQHFQVFIFKAYFLTIQQSPNVS